MIGAISKKMFLDSRKITRATDRAAIRVHTRFGARVRLTARHSIRKHRAISAPGQPPSSHAGHLREGIWYAVERPKPHNVVIGPTQLNIVFFDRHGQPVRGTVPETLEYGGTIHIKEVFEHGRWWRADLRSRRRLAGKRMRLRKARIRPRPFMHPAFEKELAKLPALWADSVC